MWPDIKYHQGVSILRSPLGEGADLLFQMLVKKAKQLLVDFRGIPALVDAAVIIPIPDHHVHAAYPADQAYLLLKLLCMNNRDDYIRRTVLNKNRRQILADKIERVRKVYQAADILGMRAK